MFSACCSIGEEPPPGAEDSLCADASSCAGELSLADETSPMFGGGLSDGEDGASFNAASGLLLLGSAALLDEAPCRVVWVVESAVLVAAPSL